VVSTRINQTHARTPAERSTLRPLYEVPSSLPFFFFFDVVCRSFIRCLLFFFSRYMLFSFRGLVCVRCTANRCSSLTGFFFFCALRDARWITA
jgi:hypothetical protein